VETLTIVAGNAHPELARRISQSLGKELTKAEVGRFPDGESKVRILEDVRGTDAFVIQPTCPPQNETLMELLIMIDALKRASAHRITAVLPYYGYARQDRKHEGRVPITAKLVANLITTAGANRVLTMDLHATQIQGFFDIPVDHLFAAPVLVKHVKERNDKDLVAVAPDPGSIKLAHTLSNRLNAGLALVEKRRLSDSTVVAGNVVGDIEGKNVVIADDMITTAGSMTEAVKAVRLRGAKWVTVMATHPVFVKGALRRLAESKPDEVVVTDTIPLKEDLDRAGLDVQVLSVAPMLGEAIKRIHTDESVSCLFK
jgi:ribose-phosphate pyrophosphokinase